MGNLLRRVVSLILVFSVLVWSFFGYSLPLVQAACTATQEKISNPGFETDLSSWNTDMSTMIQNTEPSNLVVYYPMNETSGTVAQAINPAVSEGRNILIDGDMEAADTSAYAEIWGAVSSKEITSPHGGSQVIRVTRNDVQNYPAMIQTIISPGDTYHITGYARSDGLTKPRIRGTNPSDATWWTGTTSTDWQTVDFTITNVGSASFALGASNASNIGDYIEYDDITVTQTSISASTSFSTPGDNPFDGTITNATVNQSENSLLGKSYLFDGSTSYVDIYSPELNSAFDPDEGTLLAWAKVANSGVWSDGTYDYVSRIQAGANNWILITKASTTNQLAWQYRAGGTTKQVTYTGQGATTNNLMLSTTWSKSADEVRAFVNGAQVNTTQTGLGTWSGNLVSTTVAIGAQLAAATNPWSGSISHVALWNTPLSAIEIANLNGVPSYRDTSKAHSGSASVRLEAISDSNFTQNVNVGDTNTYNLVAYAYTDGTAVTSSDAALYHNGSAITTTYTDMGSGWYKLSGSVTGANESRTYGVQVKSGKTVYVDDVSINRDIDVDCSSASSPPVCSDASPSSVPVINSITSDTSSVVVNFTPAGDPVTYYAVEYGVESGNYIYGSSNIGNVTSYTINYLSPGTTYYIRVRGGNGCTTGEWSSEGSVSVESTPSGFFVTPSEGETQPSPTPTVTPTPTSTPLLTTTPQPTAALKQVSLRLPSFHLPKLQIPKISLPTISLTMPTIPKITLSLPNISVPRLSFNLDLGGVFTRVKLSLANLVFGTGEQMQSVSDGVGYAFINFGYSFVKEPTKISNVNVEVLSPTAAKITWQTNHPATSKVNYGESLVYGQEVQSDKRVREHELVINNLEPGTKYFFEVMSQNKTYVYDAYHQFSTEGTNNKVPIDNQAEPAAPKVQGAYISNDSYMFVFIPVGAIIVIGVSLFFWKRRKDKGGKSPDQ